MSSQGEPTEPQIENENDSDDDGEPPLLISLSAGGADSLQLPVPTIKANDETNVSLPPCPVTILSGFLGSGKTTLIQYILKSPDHGKRIAVIENEFGEGLAVESMIARDGVDNSSLTELIELPNGCICCTVKDSLVATLENLMDKRRDLDYILIECSGMANPGPIASLFWLDDALESRLRLDGIVTLVDAKHILQQLQETEEAAQQIAYADRILINKTDLVDTTEPVQFAILEIHPTAVCRETSYSTVPDLDWILDANCYSDDRLEELELLANTIGTAETTATHSHDHSHDHDAPCSICHSTNTNEHVHTSGISTMSLIVPSTIDLRRLDQWLALILWPNQDEKNSALLQTITSKPSTLPKEMELEAKINNEQLIFRIKGILSVRTKDLDEDTRYIDATSGIDSRRYILQAVHDLWDVHPASDGLQWQVEEERVCKVVVIGRCLQEEQLREGFLSCFD